MAWPGTIEHRDLLQTAERMIAEVGALRGRLEHRDGVEHAQHGDFADRARGLAGRLRAAVMLTEADLYAPALGCLRTALEQTLVDHLVFLGRRVVQVVDAVDEDTWAEWSRQREAGESFTSVVSWSRTKKGQVEITSEGLRSQPAEGSDKPFLSVHYFLLKQFQPYLGSPSAQPLFDNGITEPAQDRRRAENNEGIYRMYLSWKSIKKSLESNGFADEVMINRLDVHYRFLSAFVHPLSDVDTLLYGRNVIGVPKYDHYSSELALLYTVAFAVGELRRFMEMTRHAPEVGLRDMAALEATCDEAWDKIAYLWFPGHTPHRFDRVNEANKRAFRLLRNGQGQNRVEDPATFSNDEVRYYRDPLRRLVEMHAGFHEMVTGLVFNSPWPREGARYR